MQQYCYGATAIWQLKANAPKVTDKGADMLDNKTLQSAVFFSRISLARDIAISVREMKAWPVLACSSK